MTVLHMALKISFYKFIYTISLDNEFHVRVRYAHLTFVCIVWNSSYFTNGCIRNECDYEILPGVECKKIMQNNNNFMRINTVTNQNCSGLTLKYLVVTMTTNERNSTRNYSRRKIAWEICFVDISQNGDSNVIYFTIHIFCIIYIFVMFTNFSHSKDKKQFYAK